MFGPLNSKSKIRTFDSLFDNFFMVDNRKSNVLTGIEYKKIDNTLAVVIDVPGVEEKELQIELANNVITVLGQRKTETSHYSIKKSFSVPEGYSLDDISAEVKNGILTLTLKTEDLKDKSSVKKIPIKPSK